MKLTNNHCDDKTQELIDLFESDPEKFKHLQMFLHRERDTDSRPDNYFLMVTPHVFGVVKVLDLKVEDNFINIEFLDCTMQQVGNIKIDINDARATILFICWQDIRKMVLDEKQTFSNVDLLEFDF